MKHFDAAKEHGQIIAQIYPSQISLPPIVAAFAYGRYVITFSNEKPNAAIVWRTNSRKTDPAGDGIMCGMYPTVADAIAAINQTMPVAAPLSEIMRRTD